MDVDRHADLPSLRPKRTLAAAYAVATMDAMEPVITHRDVTTVMALLGDIQEDVERIRRWLEDDDGEEEPSEDDS